MRMWALMALLGCGEVREGGQSGSVVTHVAGGRPQPVAAIALVDPGLQGTWSGDGLSFQLQLEGTARVDAWVGDVSLMHPVAELQLEEPWRDEAEGRVQIWAGRRARIALQVNPQTWVRGELDADGLGWAELIDDGESSGRVEVFREP